MRVVLDTNLLISALNLNGREREVLNLALDGTIELVLSPYIIDETVRVLRRKFGWHETMIGNAVARLSNVATVIEPTTALTVVEHDGSDNRILECAVDGAADYLVTGDRRDLLPIERIDGVVILTAARFIATFAAGDPS